MSAQIETPTLVVLAGGESSRMGRPKSALPIGGEMVLARILHRLGWTGATMLVLASLDQKPPGGELFDRVIADKVPGCGPLMGIYSALNEIKTTRAIFVPVDMPMLGRDVIDELVRTNSIGLLCRRIFNSKELIEPFPSIFKKEAIGPIKLMLDQNRRSLHGLLKDSRFTTHDATHWPAEAWINLNTPEDLARYETLFSK